MPAHHGKFVSYYRVSTDRQGRSGLGLDAQKEAVQQRLDGGRWQLVAEFVEIESGKRAKRPQLDAARSGSTSVTRRLILNQPRCPAAGEHHVLDRADAAQVGRAKSRR